MEIDGGGLQMRGSVGREWVEPQFSTTFFKKEVTYSSTDNKACLLLTNILLQKFDASSEKGRKLLKQFFNEKQQKPYMYFQMIGLIHICLIVNSMYPQMVMTLVLLLKIVVFLRVLF